MRTPDYTNKFKRDYKREKRGRHRATLDADLEAVLSALLADIPLEPRRRDHALTGNWKDCRDCHIKPDPGTLRLVRPGSHSAPGL